MNCEKLSWVVGENPPGVKGASEQSLEHLAEDATAGLHHIDIARYHLYWLQSKSQQHLYVQRTITLSLFKQLANPKAIPTEPSPCHELATMNRLRSPKRCTESQKSSNMNIKGSQPHKNGLTRLCRLNYTFVKFFQTARFTRRNRLCFFVSSTLVVALRLARLGPRDNLLEPRWSL